MKRVLVLGLLLFGFLPGSFAQSFVSRYINRVLKDTTDGSRPVFITYPVVAYAPETSWEIGLSSLYVYHAKNDINNRLSEVNAFTFLTFENQYGLFLDHAIYTDKNKWFLLGNIRFQSFPLKYHGIGMDTPKDYLALVDGLQLVMKERILREVRRNLYLGLEIDFQKLSRVDFLYSADAMDFPLPLGAGGSANLGLGLGVVYDDRHNVLNVRRGNFSELAFMNFSPAINNFSFSEITSETRIFRPVGKNNVIAWHLLGRFMTGEVPFNQLALMGGESLMRGYYLGRFRDKNMIASQVEFRMLPLPLPFTDRIGAAAFAGAGSVFPEFSAAAINKVVWSAGGGLRFLLFPKKDIYTRFDVAFTQEGSGFYLFIGESF